MQGNEHNSNAESKTEAHSHIAMAAICADVVGRAGRQDTNNNVRRQSARPGSLLLSWQRTKQRRPAVTHANKHRKYHIKIQLKMPMMTKSRS